MPVVLEWQRHLWACCMPCCRQTGFSKTVVACSNRDNFGVVRSIFILQFIVTAISPCPRCYCNCVLLYGTLCMLFYCEPTTGLFHCYVCFVVCSAAVMPFLVAARTNGIHVIAYPSSKSTVDCHARQVYLTALSLDNNNEFCCRMLWGNAIVIPATIQPDSASPSIMDSNLHCSN